MCLSLGKGCMRSSISSLSLDYWRFPWRRGLTISSRSTRWTSSYCNGGVVSIKCLTFCAAVIIVVAGLYQGEGGKRVKWGAGTSLSLGCIRVEVYLWFVSGLKCISGLFRGWSVSLGCIRVEVYLWVVSGLNCISGLYQGWSVSMGCIRVEMYLWVVSGLKCISGLYRDWNVSLGCIGIEMYHPLCLFKLAKRQIKLTQV